ncbi:MAG: glycosyltransferase family 39 protein [Sulfurospirillaceae bacterium]|nr:glycosyltransferase family 39 protein [Sulfurospirillaceae bacterium]
MKENLQIFFILFVSSLCLLLETQSVSISNGEAQIYFGAHSLLYYFSHIFTGILGQNDLALRLPFIILHVFSLFLIYKIGKLFLKRKSDRVLSTAIFALLPGINSAAILVNSASLVIFITLLFVFLYMHEYKSYSYLVLILALFVDNSFSVLYLSLFFYAISKKDNKMLVFALILFGLSMSIYGFDDSGKPKGYFLDTMGVYSAIFSPFLFLYYVYTLYRILIKEEKSLLWYISFVALMFSLFLSLRQRLHLEDFAPFVILAIPLMVKVFLNSYRVRLPQYRRWHKVISVFVVVFLIVNTFFIFVNKPLYALYENPQRHFAYKYEIAKELSNRLKALNIHEINTLDNNLRLRLKFYGIKYGGDDILDTRSYGTKVDNTITIAYYGTIVARFYIYKE